MPWLPERLRRWARWLPHLTVGFFSVLVFLAGMADSGPGSLQGLLAAGFAVLVAAAPLLTLFRPVGAYWLSLFAAVVGDSPTRPSPRIPASSGTVPSPPSSR